jgi:hypothetical protein
MLASASEPVMPNSNSTLSGVNFHHDNINAQAMNIGTKTTTLWKQTTTK